ncbi:MAG: formylglycine-generating enzyme family protein [Opitutaceae bacterium]
MALFKKSQDRRLSHEPTVAKRVFQGFLWVCAAAAVLVGFWFLTRLGPQTVDYREVRENLVVSDDIVALKAKSMELQAQFEEVLAIREAEDQDIVILKQALDTLEQYLDQYPGIDSDAEKHRSDLRQRYQDLAASGMYKESLELERDAESLALVKDYENARIKYREAYRLQNKINEDFPISSAYDVGRATRMQRQARYLTAQPLYERSVEFEKKGIEFMEAHDWEQAEEHLQTALSIQDQLNREFRGTNQSSVSRLEELRIKLVGIRSGQSYLEVERVSELADASRVKGENLEAASFYLEAARLQRQLNEQYTDSPYASSEQVAEFQRKAQTAESFELGREIELNNDRLKTFLAKRQTYEAAEVISELRRDIKQMQDAYPRSSLNDEELQLKIRYLNLVQNDLGFIQDRVYDSLLPIPEEKQWKMLRTEVPQALYSLIMGTNPSRNQGDVLPVDSVSWSEAKSFCKRLSWIIGKPVRLPTENEFRQALGKLRYVVLEDHVWSVANAAGVAKGVGLKTPFASGYFDLLGNVSEWLESLDRFNDEDARHIGGHAQDRLEAIFTVPVRDAARGERNRMTGFRFVVETDS